MAAARRALALSLEPYKQAAADYLTVVSSQATAPQTQLDTLDLERLQLRASVALMRAVGGGWTGPESNSSGSRKGGAAPVANTVAPRS
jgi:outer membrane protein TolC